MALHRLAGKRKDSLYPHPEKLIPVLGEEADGREKSLYEWKPADIFPGLTYG